MVIFPSELHMATVTVFSGFAVVEAQYILIRKAFFPFRVSFFWSWSYQNWHISDVML